MRASRRVRRALTLLAGFATLGVGLIALAHTPPGRPLLALLGRLSAGRGSCPLGYDRPATSAERDRIQRTFSANLRGDRPAERRPALVFDFDRTRKADVSSFMAAHGISCRLTSGMADMSCDGIPATLLGLDDSGQTKRSLWFVFGDADRLVSLIAVSKTGAPGLISDAYQWTTQQLSERVGPPWKVTGEASSAFLSGGTLHQASAEFRFSNYYASARATNMGNGFLLTEEYRALVPATNRARN